jgi:hypothetical protein
MSWKNHLKEKLVDAARRIADNQPTIARYTALTLSALYWSEPSHSPFLHSSFSGG